jgi:hypothetical protein
MLQTQSTVTLQKIVNIAMTFGDIEPVLNVSGQSSNPATVIATDVMNAICGVNFPHKWNEINLPVFYTNSWQQDYAVVWPSPQPSGSPYASNASLTNLAWLDVDGQSVALVAVNAWTGAALNVANSVNFNIGYDNAATYLTASVDEARVSNIARGPDWELTEYNNQSSPSTFYTLSNIPITGGSINLRMLMGMGT